MSAIMSEHSLIPVVCQTCRHQPPWMREANDVAGRCKLHDMIVFEWDLCIYYELDVQDDRTENYDMEAKGDMNETELEYCRLLAWQLCYGIFHESSVHNHQLNNDVREAAKWLNIEAGGFPSYGQLQTYNGCLKECRNAKLANKTPKWVTEIEKEYGLAKK